MFKPGAHAFMNPPFLLEAAPTGTLPSDPNAVVIFLPRGLMGFVARRQELYKPRGDGNISEAVTDEPDLKAKTLSTERGVLDA